MARPGITYTDVAEAASELLGQGRNPTVEQIRLFLGTGSSTTIANHLREWKECQAGTSLLAVKENIPQELVAIVKGLWERVLNQSEEKVSDIEANYQQSFVELQQECQKYKNNNRRWQKLFNQWIKEHEQLIQDKLAQQEIISGLQTDKAALLARQAADSQYLQEKQERTAELYHLLQQAQANLEHYRESVSVQRTLEQAQHEKHIEGLRLELKRHEEQILELRERASLLTQQQQSLQNAYTAVETENAANMKLIKHWQNAYQDKEKKLALQSQQLITLQAEHKMLSKQLMMTQQTVDAVREQNKLLEQEKWTLMQEKIQIEEQLKQLEL